MRAIDKNWGACPICHQIVKFSPEKDEEFTHCPRCGADVYLRKPFSIQITWAFLLASIIFYIPANLLPMMNVHTFKGDESSTIMSGVIYFIESGSYLIGAVIFIASILVPSIKILILAYLLLSVQFRVKKRKEERLKLYRLTEIIGKWSMVDIYVVSIMVALVHFGALSNIKAGMGALFFLLVVMTTMLSAMSFDSRLIWDEKVNTDE